MISWKLQKILPITDEQAKTLMTEIKIDPTFYSGLELQEPDSWYSFVDRYNNTKHEVTFITSRHPNSMISVREISKQWLARHGWTNPSVVVTDRKGLACKELEIEYFVDDSLKNCLDVYAVCGDKCQVFLVDYPHNRDHEVPQGIIRINSFEQFVHQLF